MNQGSVSFTREQIIFLMEKTGADSPNEALEIFVAVMQKEGVDPIRMPVYLKKMMEKQGTAK